MEHLPNNVENNPGRKGKNHAKTNHVSLFFLQLKLEKGERHMQSENEFKEFVILSMRRAKVQDD